MPPSTTAEAAATFCSYVYLACLPSMVSSASLPNARYICCHFSTVWRGTRRVLAVDVRPWPRSKSSDALLRTSISCFTLRSVRIRKAPHFSMSKKWEAVHSRCAPFITMTAQISREVEAFRYFTNVVQQKMTSATATTIAATMPTNLRRDVRVCSRTFFSVAASDSTCCICWAWYCLSESIRAASC